MGSASGRSKADAQDRSEPARARSAPVLFGPQKAGKTVTAAAQTDHDTPPTAEVDLRQLIAALWRQGHFIVVTPLVLFVLVVTYLHLATPLYTVTLTVTAVEREQPLSGAAGAAGVAALAGIDLSALSGESEHFDLYLAGLTSRAAARTLSPQPNLLPRLFPDEWSAERGLWVEPSGPLTPIKDTIKSVLGLPYTPWAPPDAERLHEFLVEDMVIIRDRLSPVVTIRVEHANPQAAEDLLNALHRAVDDMLRARSLERAEQYIQYLDRQLAASNIADVRSALIQARTQQEKHRMVASAGGYFAAEPFDPPAPSRRPTSPKAVLLLILAIVAGGLLGALFAITADVLGWRPLQLWPRRVRTRRVAPPRERQP